MPSVDFTDCLDLVILGSPRPSAAVGFARRNGDVVISEIPGGTSFQNLLDFAERIRLAVEPGALGRPADSDLIKFGNDLFEFCFGANFRGLYTSLPASHIRL